MSRRARSLQKVASTIWSSCDELKCSRLGQKRLVTRLQIDIDSLKGLQDEAQENIDTWKSLQNNAEPINRSSESVDDLSENLRESDEAASSSVMDRVDVNYRWAYPWANFNITWAILQVIKRQIMSGPAWDWQHLHDRGHGDKMQYSLWADQCSLTMKPVLLCCQTCNGIWLRQWKIWAKSELEIALTVLWRTIETLYLHEGLKLMPDTNMKVFFAIIRAGHKLRLQSTVSGHQYLQFPYDVSVL